MHSGLEHLTFFILKTEGNNKYDKGLIQKFEINDTGLLGYNESLRPDYFSYSMPVQPFHRHIFFIIIIVALVNSCNTLFLTSLQYTISRYI